MLKLSQSQEKIVKQKNIGPSVIKGAAGSGKTAIAIGRMLYLVEHACKTGEKVLFMTGSKAQKNKVTKWFWAYYEKQNISLFDEEIKGEVVIKAIDDLIEEAADKAHVHLNLEVVENIPEEILRGVIKSAQKSFPRVKWLKETAIEIVAYELQWMHTCGFFDFEAYQIAARKGATIKLPKKGSGRQAMWMMKEEVSKQLKAEGKMLKSEMQLETLQYLKEDALRNCYEHMIIDDAERLNKVQLEFAHYLKSDTKGEVLFMMGKDKQADAFAWLANGHHFKSIGYDMTGRVKQLMMRKKQKAAKKQEIQVQLTPLELFMAEQDKILKATVSPAQDGKRSLPWYVETYKYINKVTGIETIFQKDSSAGETYIDEIKQEEVEVLPIYSDIAAGVPIEIVDEESGTFEVPRDLLHHRRHTYVLHVQGDSMTGADILDGDYVVIQAGNVNNHEIAAVYYNGATTLKRIVQEEEQILLCSENPKYGPIAIEEGDFRVMGKLVGVIKSIEA